MKERRKKETNLGADGEIFKHDDKSKKTGNISYKHIQNSFQGIISILPICYMHDKENVKNYKVIHLNFRK